MKKQILSVLLLAFTFFVVHDYCIDYSDNSFDSIHQKTCASSTETNLLEDIHDDIHTMFEVNLNPFLVADVFIADNKELRNKYTFLSYLVFPLNKPPVI